MSLRLLVRLVWIVPAILLAIAVARLPYGYSTFARIVMCSAAMLIAIVASKNAHTEAIGGAIHAKDSFTETL